MHIFMLYNHFVFCSPVIISNVYQIDETENDVTNKKYIKKRNKYYFS